MSTVGRDEAVIRAYIQRQEEEEGVVAGGAFGQLRPDQCPEFVTDCPNPWQPWLHLRHCTNKLGRAGQTMPGTKILQLEKIERL